MQTTFTYSLIIYHSNICHFRDNNNYFRMSYFKCFIVNSEFRMRHKLVIMQFRHPFLYMICINVGFDYIMFARYNLKFSQHCHDASF